MSEKWMDYLQGGKAIQVLLLAGFALLVWSVISNSIASALTGIAFLMVGIFYHAQEYGRLRAVRGQNS